MTTPWNTNRYRERETAMPLNNKVKAGQMFRVEASNGQRIAWYEDYYTQTGSSPQIREGTWDYINPGPPYLTGWDFTNITSNIPTFEIKDAGKYRFHNDYQPASWDWEYEGGFYDPQWSQQWDTMSDADYSVSGIANNLALVPDLSSIGAGAYAKLRPRLEQAGLAVALAEAKDLPRMLSSTAKTFANIWSTLGGNLRNNPMAPKKAADSFINHQFGWVPFVKDVGDMYRTFDNSTKYLAQIKRDNNQWVRRFRSDKNIESETIVHYRNDIHGCSPSGLGYTWNMMDFMKPKTFTVKLQELTQVWYEGVFKYFRPEFSDSGSSVLPILDPIRRQMTLYGANINPVVVWKATPWTWLADWFTNVGDAIQQGQDWATDSVVSKYMYLMHHRYRRYEMHSHFTTRDGGVHDLRWYRSAEIKRRQRAGSSFNFVLSGELTPRQLAILGALGISRT